jgi:8-oxo-dGTP diphosphatase
LVVVRHALSVPRKEWRGEDRDRPLSRDGRAQSDRVADLVAAWAPTRIVTSSARRCRDTVGPLAERLRVPLELEDVLTEEAFEDHPRRSRTFVKELRETREAIVLCTHRPLLPMIADLIGVDLPRHARSNPLPKGACWVAHSGPKDPVERYAS